jgi:type IV pilus assembly protein PilE
MLRSHEGMSQIRYTKVRGFTLIELLITVAIMGILATIAYPSYNDFVVRSNRSEAPRELVRLANLQEQFFVDSRAYTTNISDLGVGTTSQWKTPNGNYTISSTVVGSSFTLTATAIGAQATDDSDCALITLTDTGSKNPSICWER